jgi:hypothetical protein
MTVYEINYKKRLNEMLDALIIKWDIENPRVILFATYVDKLIDHPNYQNRELMEKMFKAFS